MCILVVEDDFLIRTILVEELEEAGYHVKEAQTGDEAVEVFQHLDRPLSVLVTDIHMPGSRSGIDVARFVRTRMPRVPVIFTTGRPDAMKGTVTLGHDQVLIRKPYVASYVIERIKTLLLD